MTTFGDIIYQLGGVPVNSEFTTGDVYFVHSGTGSNSNEGKKPGAPVASFDYATGLCTANKGDIIYGMPGHTESISAAGTITSDVAGVKIQGLGFGHTRPIVTWDTAAAACWNVTGANCVVDNLICNANIADVVMAYDIDAKNFTIQNCKFIEQASAKNFLSCIGTDDTNNAADGLAILNNRRISVDEEALAFVSILANITDLQIKGNFDNQASAADIGHFLILGAFDVLGAEITHNHLNLTGNDNATAVGIFVTGSSTDCTGTMAYNLCGSLNTTGLFATATLGFQQFENKYTGVIAKSGYTDPLADS